MERCERNDQLSREALDDEWNWLCANCRANLGELWRFRINRWDNLLLRCKRGEFGGGECEFFASECHSSRRSCERDDYGRPDENPYHFALHLRHEFLLGKYERACFADF